MTTARGLLELCPVVPVLTVDDPGRAEDIALALRDGGIPVAEITLRTPQGIDAIARVAGLDGFTVGAGTVVHWGDVARVADAGARFGVAPGIDPEVVERATEAGLPFLPGIATASELQVALRLGLDAVKVFPAAVLGGPAFLRALAAPFPGVVFLPSGGIDLALAREYLDARGVSAVSGSWMVPAGAEPDRIRELATETIATLT